MCPARTSVSAAQPGVSLNVGWSVSSGSFFQYPFTSRPAFFRYAVMMSERSSAGTSVTAYVIRLPFCPSRVDTMNSEPLCCNGMTGTRCRRLQVGHTAIIQQVYPCRQWFPSGDLGSGSG